MYHKYLLKEYVLLLILDHLSATSYIRKLVFIGGTSIRLIKGIDRFSEDIDFDCKNFSRDEFREMTDNIVKFLGKNGLYVETKEGDALKLNAFRSNLLFPELLFKLGLTGHREERFLIKLECQDQLVDYRNIVENIRGCGFYFPMPAPPASILCAMKVAAMLNRQKGRDFYDAMFLCSQTLPDFDFLEQRTGITNLKELKDLVLKVISDADLKNKMRDFEHLLFNKSNSSRILHAADFFSKLQ
jgi:predicted nucleotidyltransferase component of viral defense system